MLNRQSHIKYFLRHLSILPSPYSGQDTYRLTICYFCLGGLDILNALEQIPNKNDIINWIYSLQIISTKYPEHSGFLGGSFLGKEETEFHKSHITMVYTALAALKILGDDFSRVKKERNFVRFEES